MMIGSGRSDRRQPQDRRAAATQRRAPANKESKMARITASVYSSHIPAVGAAFDLGKTL